MNQREFVTSLLDSALGYYDKGKFTEALSAYLDIKNQYGELYPNGYFDGSIGACYYAADRFQEALEPLKTYCEAWELVSSEDKKDSNYALALYRIATSYYEIRRYEDAIAAYREVVAHFDLFSLDDDSLLRYNTRLLCGRAHRFLGNNKPAIVEFSEALKEAAALEIASGRETSVTVSNLDLAKTYYSDGDLQKLSEHLSAVVPELLTPLYRIDYFMLKLSLLSQEQEHGELVSFYTSNSEMIEGTERESDALCFLGVAYYALDKLDKARKSLESSQSMRNVREEIKKINVEHLELIANRNKSKSWSKSLGRLLGFD